MLLLHIFQIWRTAENAADHTPINPPIYATAQPQKERREKFRRNMGLRGCGSGKGHPANQEHPWGSPKPCKLIPYFNAECPLVIFLNHQIIPSHKSLRMDRKFIQARTSDHSSGGSCPHCSIKRQANATQCYFSGYFELKYSNQCTIETGHIFFYVHVFSEPLHTTSLDGPMRNLMTCPVRGTNKILCRQRINWIQPPTKDHSGLRK
ncbi:hypothetical protein DdX_08002 [Ditylenchus destructor]|uniref:Uncharacterized protein n=1 Tax=Ditylenchus destructor TaxID=166010 RepID=A0AAD4N992_9BILA|nr:hypothetical protein DdX_08002 [Ditylenchus destructor]